MEKRILGRVPAYYQVRVIPFYRKQFGAHLPLAFAKIESDEEFDFPSDLHYATFYEIVVFFKGEGVIRVDGEVITLHDSFFLFISPHQKRQWEVDKKKVQGWHLAFETDFLASFFSDQLFPFRLQYFYNRQVPPYFQPTNRLFSFKHDIFTEMLDELANPKTDSRHLLRSLLYYILIKLNRAFCQYHQLEPDTQANNYAFRFKEELEKHIRHKHAVTDYAQLLGVSRVSLNKAIKEQFGVTTSEMIHERLLYEVKSELLYTTYSVAEIAFRLNFSEPNNLTRFFKRRTGSPPLIFRAGYQNDSSFA